MAVRGGRNVSVKFKHGLFSEKIEITAYNFYKFTKSFLGRSGC